MLDLIRSNSEKAVPEARQIFNELKNEAADEVGLWLPRDGHCDNPKRRMHGKTGGYMVKKLIEAAESGLIGKM